MGEEGKGTDLKTVVRILNIVCGIGIIVITILQIIFFGFVEFWNYFQYIYWLLFGALIITAEFKIEFMLKYFKFLEGNIGKGWFLIFAGTWMIGDFANGGSDLMASITGFVLIGCGIVTICLLSCCG